MQYSGLPLLLALKKNNFFCSFSELWEFRYDALPHLVFVCKSTEKSVRDLKHFLANYDDSGLKRQTNILAFLLKTVRQQSKVIEDSLSDKTTFYQVLFGLMSTLSTLVSYPFKQSTLGYQ